MKNTYTPSIGIIYFGITRSLSTTISGIEDNVVCPARRSGNLRLFAFLYDLERIENPRSGEVGVVEKDDLSLFGDADVELLTPGSECAMKYFSQWRDFGDHWGDEFRSLKNLAHQLYSVEVATEKALSEGADIVIFCRPDLMYHDSLEKYIERAVKLDRKKIDAVFVPNWQAWLGQNDRFAICVGRKAIEAYGFRARKALPYLHKINRSLQGEQLLGHTLKMSGVKVFYMSARASRVRVGGRLHQENFQPRHLEDMKWLFRRARSFMSRPKFFSRLYEKLSQAHRG